MRPAVLHVGLACSWALPALLLAAAMLAGCSASLPPLVQQNGAGVQADAGSAGPGEAVARPAGAASQLPVTQQASRVPDTRVQAQLQGSGIISAFRARTVVLFSSETGNEGVMVSAASLPTPMPANSPTSTSARVEIDTVTGPKWIARTDVVFGNATR